MKIEELTYSGHNPKTREIKEFVNKSFYKDEHPMKSISTVNVKIIAEALFETYKKNYCIEDIELCLCMENGCVITMQLDPLDDWDIDGDYSKQWLHKHLKQIIDVLGKPSDIVECDNKYYARWIRNVVTWF